MLTRLSEPQQPYVVPQASGLQVDVQQIMTQPAADRDYSVFERGQDRPVQRRDVENSGITLERLKHPAYALLNERERSLKAWPKHQNQKPSDIARAGFFYTGLLLTFKICSYIFLSSLGPLDK